MSTADTAADAHREAAQLLAAAGTPDRLLAVHRADASGRCAGCPTPRPPWPCSVAAIAAAATKIPAPRRTT